MAGFRNKCKNYVEKGNFEPFIKAVIAFHNFLVGSSQNLLIQMIMNNINAQIQLGRMESFFVPGRTKKSLKEHEEIIHAMLKGDVSKAERFIRKHCINIKKNVLCFLKTRHKK